MSYDLYFTPTQSLPTRDEFVAYFADRGRYTIEHSQAFYQNEDTGVYFYFEYSEPSDDDESDSDSIAFNLNYFRPHFFGLEAGPEVESFVQRFALNVSDPQTDGMDDGPFSVDGFLRGWNAGNRFAYRAILSSDDRPDLFVYPTDGLEQAWKWNYGRDHLQDQVGDALFVPKYMFMKSDQRACTAIVWPDACPIYMPQSDLVFLLRHELSSNSSANGSPEITIVKWQQIAPMIAPFPQYDGDVPYFRLDYDAAPDHIVDFVRSQPLLPPDEDMALANDDVHNEELVAEALQDAE